MNIILTLASSFLFALSFPNPFIENGVQGLSAIALVPLLYALARTRNIKIIRRLGMLFGVVSTLLSYYWLTRFGEFSIWTISSVALVYLIEYALLFACLSLIITRTSPLLRPFMIAFTWVGFEYVKSVGYLGFPWTLLAQSLHNIPVLIQIAGITGSWGISLLLAYSNAIVLEYLLYTFRSPLFHAHRSLIPTRMVKAQFRMHLMCMSTLLGITILYGSVQLYIAKKTLPDFHLPTLLVQQNLDSWNNIPPQESVAYIINLTKKGLAEASLTEETRPRLILWSETSLRVPYQIEDKSSYSFQFYNNIPQDESFFEFVKTTGIPIITGTSLKNLNDSDSRSYYNGATLIKPDATNTEFYGKNQLVPMAEFMPYYNLPVVRTLMADLFNIQSGWIPWGTFNTFDVPLGSTLEEVSDIHTSTEARSVKIGIAICFEDAFASVTRNLAHNGAELLVNLSNVSWSKTRTAQNQQLAAAKFRSIETGITLARSTNSGVSSVIDPWGRVITQIPMFIDTTLFVDIPIYRSIKPPYLVLGDFVARIVGLLSLLYIFLLLYGHTLPPRIKKRFEI